MRMIDADALMKSMYHQAFETDEDTMWQSGCWVRYRAIEKVVEEQPTIEPMRKKGKWIDGVLPNDSGGLQVQVCDQCNTFFPLAYTGGGHNYCPNCGARMEGED